MTTVSNDHFSNTDEIRNVFFLDRLVDLVMIAVKELDNLDEERVVPLYELVPDRLHEQIDPFRVLYREVPAVVPDGVRVVADNDDGLPTDPVDDLVDPGAFARVFVGVVLVLVDLDNDAMRGKIKIDVGTLLAAPLEHLARIVFEARVDLPAEKADDRPFLLVLDLFAIFADKRGVLPDVAVLAQPFEDDEVGISREVPVAVFLVLKDVVVLLITIQDAALVFQDEVDHGVFLMCVAELGTFIDVPEKGLVAAFVILAGFFLYVDHIFTFVLKAV